MAHEGPVFASGSEDIRNSNVKAQALKATEGDTVERR